jgi:hypothetical protein
MNTTITTTKETQGARIKMVRTSYNSAYSGTDIKFFIKQPGGSFTGRDEYSFFGLDRAKELLSELQEMINIAESSH